jgi:hypothetical protein
MEEKHQQGDKAKTKTKSNLIKPCDNMHACNIMKTTKARKTQKGSRYYS